MRNMFFIQHNICNPFATIFSSLTSLLYHHMYLERKQNSTWSKPNQSFMYYIYIYTPLPRPPITTEESGLSSLAKASSFTWALKWVLCDVGPFHHHLNMFQSLQS